MGKEKDWEDDREKENGIKRNKKISIRGKWETDTLCHKETVEVVKSVMFLKIWSIYLLAVLHNHCACQTVGSSSPLVQFEVGVKNVWYCHESLDDLPTAAAANREHRQTMTCQSLLSCFRARWQQNLISWLTADRTQSSCNWPYKHGTDSFCHHKINFCTLETASKRNVFLSK